MKTVRCTLSQLPSGIIDRLNKAMFFSSVGFAQLWKTLGGREVYWLTKENNQVLAVLPGVEFGRKPLKRFQAMPAGCYAELITVRESLVDRRQIALSTVRALKAEKYLKLYLTDYHSHFAGMTGFSVTESETILVDITSEDWQPPDKKIQSEIRKAEREGVIVQRFDAGRHFDGFLSLVRKTEQRHGRRVFYRESFYRALAALAEKDEHVRWLYTEYDGQPAASHINFILGDTVLNWQVYSDRAYSFLKPNQYLLYSVARETAPMGVRFLSLGSSPEEADSLLAYKRKWGGCEYSYRHYYLESKLAGLL